MIVPRYQKVLSRVCAKGGGGGDTYDAAYNARMADIAEEQQGWAREMYNWYLYGTGGSPGHYEKRLVEGGGQGGTSGGSQGGGSQGGGSTGQEASWTGRPEWDQRYVYRGGRQTGNPGAIGGGNQGGSGDVYEEVWVEGTDGGYSYRDMEDDMLAYNREEIAAAMGLLPDQTKLSHMQLNDAMTFINERAPVRTEFFNQALNGMDPERMADLAAADATQAFMNAEAGKRRSAARAGVGPDSGRYAAMSNQNAINQAKTVGSARTQARFVAEKENFGRLNSAMGLGG